MKEYKRGEVSKLTGVGFEGIRFYEKAELIPLPERNSAGHRVYSEEMIERIKFLQHASKLGFTLKESKELLEINSNCESVNQKVKVKIKNVKEKIKALRQIEKSLTLLQKKCSSSDSIKNCPIISIIKSN
jgi:DNA-binding transcriptional MerR regulator